VFSSNEELKPSVVHLEDSIQNAIELAARGLGPEIKISTHIGGAVPPLFVDAAGLESAMLNLLDMLRLNGCDSAQGYYFSRPLPAAELVNWLGAYRSQLQICA
jgi:hypothetical protein